MDAATCPNCGAKGKSVANLTVSVMVKSSEFYLHPGHLPDGKYFMCEAKACPIVYFNNENHAVFREEDIRVRVWQKQQGADVPACYCFHHTISSIGRELEEKGSTDVLARIGAEIRAGNCRCEVTNPQGSCCLGNVAKAVKMAKQRTQTKLTVVH